MQEVAWFNSDECGFRKTVKGGNLVVMHGIIRLSRERGYIVVKGYANWLPLLFFLWLIGFFLILGGDWNMLYSPFFMLMHLIFGFSYISEISILYLIGMRITGRI